MAILFVLLGLVLLTFGVGTSLSPGINATLVTTALFICGAVFLVGGMLLLALYDIRDRLPKLDPRNTPTYRADPEADTYRHREPRNEWEAHNAQRDSSVVMPPCG